MSKEDKPKVKVKQPGRDVRVQASASKGMKAIKAKKAAAAKQNKDAAKGRKKA